MSTKTYNISETMQDMTSSPRHILHRFGDIAVIST